MSDDPSFRETQETHRAKVLVFDEDDSSNLVERLTRFGFQARFAGRALSVNSLPEDSHPDLLLARLSSSEGSAATLRELNNSATKFGIPLVVVVDRVDRFDDALAVLAEADDWLFAERVERELVIRLSSVLKRRSVRKKPSEVAKAPAADSQFFRLVAHDLRSPLNVIGLSLRLISQAVPADDSEIAEDFRFIEENVGQIERMITQISDYFRLFEYTEPLAARRISPKGIVEELIATRSDKPSTRFGKIDLIVQDSCPEVVELDPIKARLAISYVLANATAAAGLTPIRLILSGGQERLRVEAMLESSPPASVSSTPLSSFHFVRLCGVAAERRGMDLAIAAKVSELFGGWARLEVHERVKTAIVMEWPLRIPRARVDRSRPLGRPFLGEA